MLSPLASLKDQQKFRYKLSGKSFPVSMVTPFLDGSFFLVVPLRNMELPKQTYFHLQDLGVINCIFKRFRKFCYREKT